MSNRGNGSSAAPRAPDEESVDKGQASPTRRRTSLAQNRSRETRRRLVLAALSIWAERGFETGVEETTIEEIVAAAGVTKGTFYFHFGHKRDLLLELAWETADSLYNMAARGVAGHRSGLVLIRELISSLGRSVEKTPKTAVLKWVWAYHAAGPTDDVPGRRHMRDAFLIALEAARAQGEIPETVDLDELAGIMLVLVMQGVFRWANGPSAKLTPILLRRCNILIAAAEAGLPEVKTRGRRGSAVGR